MIPKRQKAHSFNLKEKQLILMFSDSALMITITVDLWCSSERQLSSALWLQEANMLDTIGPHSEIKDLG